MSRLLVFALTLLAAAFAIRSLAPQTLGETARRQLLAQLKDHYRDYDVSIRRGHYEPSVGLIFEDLRIQDPSAPIERAAERDMVRIERLIVLADIHPEKLLEQQIPLTTKRIIMEGVQANAWLTSEDELSLGELLPMPRLGPVAPRMEMRRVSVRFQGDVLSSRPIDAEFDEVVIVNLPNVSGGIDRTITMHGSTDFASDVLIRIESTGDVTDTRCAVQGASLGRDLFDRLPSKWSDRLQEAREFQCLCDATLAVYQVRGQPVDYRLRTAVQEGRFAHPALPKPVSQLSGIVVCDPTGITINSSHANLGDAVVRATGKVSGYEWTSDADFDIDTVGLLLDDRLASSLPAKLQRGWDRLQAVGRVNVDAKVSRRNGNWNTDAEVTCKGVDIRYDKFPFPIENLVGKVSIRDKIASSDSLSGRIGGNRMQCLFQLPVEPEITNEKKFAVATSGPVSIDNTLLHALSPRGSLERSGLEKFVRSLNPRGSIHLASALFETDAAGRQHRTIDLRVSDGHLQYDRFAYPLDNVSGNIHVDDDVVEIAGFRATNSNAGIVHCDGTFYISKKKSSADGLPNSDPQRSMRDQTNLVLNFRATDVPMDTALRTALPAGSQQVWDAISPSGVLDQLNVNLRQRGADTPVILNVTAAQRESEQVTSRSLSLRPISLPYRIDVTGGTVHFDGSEVKIDSIHGKHDASTLSADGRCVQDESGRWNLFLNLHSGSRLRPDAELIAALPSQMREALRRLQLRGPVSVRGKTQLALPDAHHIEPAIRWDLALQLEGNRIGDVGPVHSLRGEVSVRGIRDELGIRAIGDVYIDSMHVYDLQITGIRGPFSIDGDLLEMGGKSKVPVVPGSTAKAATGRAPSISGKLFEGTIDLDGEVILSSGSFDVGLALKNGQVPTLLADFGHTDSELSGTLSGQTQLQGNLGTTNLLKGSGAAKVTDAKLYQLPFIVKLLNLLSVSPTEDVAFTDAELEFTVFGDTVTFNELQIWGDLVALQGGGTFNGRRELDLTFNTRVNPRNTFSQFFRPLSSQKYTLWTIDVRGPLHSLEIERRDLEGVVGETLERFFQGVTEPSQSTHKIGKERGLRRWLR